MTFLARTACTVILIGLSAPSAWAAYVVDLTRVGANFVATGSGTIDLTDLHLATSFGQQAQISPVDGLILTGPATAQTDLYRGNINGPTSFGSEAGVSATSGSGDLVGVMGDSILLFVPHGYVSGATLSDTAIYSMGPSCDTQCVTPGVYKWSWGTGAHADSFTLDASGLSAVPELSTWVMMLAGFAGLGLAAWIKGGAVRSAARCIGS